MEVREQQASKRGAKGFNHVISFFIGHHTPLYLMSSPPPPSSSLPQAPARAQQQPVRPAPIRRGPPPEMPPHRVSESMRVLNSAESDRHKARPAHLSRARGLVPRPRAVSAAASRPVPFPNFK